MKKRIYFVKLNIFRQIFVAIFKLLNFLHTKIKNLRTKFFLKFLEIHVNKTGNSLEVLVHISLR